MFQKLSGKQKYSTNKGININLIQYDLWMQVFEEGLWEGKGIYILQKGTSTGKF